jgi:hypothetical protein
VRSARMAAMESKLARQSEQDLIALMRRLTPEERLNAFLAHCQLMMELYQAGQQLRSASLPKAQS